MQTNSTKHCMAAIALVMLFLTSNAQSPTAPALGFNVFLQKGATLVTNETEGPIAMGGDLTLQNSSYQVATHSAGTFKVNNVAIGLVVGGQVNYTSGNTLYVNTNGYIKIGSCGSSKVWYKDMNNAYSPIRITPGTDYNGSPRISLQTNSQQLGVSETVNPVCEGGLIDFNAAFTQMKASAASIATNDDNTEVTNANGQIIPHTNLPSQIKLNLKSGFNFLNLTGTEMNKVTDFIFNNKPDATHVLVVNVNAPGSFSWSVYNSGGIGFSDCPYIFYNFYNTTTLTIQGYGAIEGTVFAPYADIIKTANQSNIEGQIIAQSYIHSGGENHYPPFTPTIPTGSPVCNLAVTGTKTDITCNGAANGSIDITVTGNSGAVSYLWNDGSTAEDRTGLTPGKYAVTVTSGSCEAKSDTFVISQPAPIVVTGTKTDITCNGAANGSIDITVTGNSGAVSYLWNDGSTAEDRTGLTPGKYAVTVTSGNCEAKSDTFVISQPAPIVVTGIKTDIACHGANNGAIDITVTGNNGTLSYLWNDGLLCEDRPDIPAGTYSLHVKDAAGCEATSETFVITQPDGIKITGVTTDVTVAGSKNGTINVTVTGGVPPYNYKWNDGATTEDRTGLAKGVYTLQVTDANGCYKATAFLVNLVGVCELEVDANVKQVTCYDGSDAYINLTVRNATAPVSYLWNDGATTQDRINIPAGKYSVKITDARGCKIVSPTLTLKQPDKITGCATVTAPSAAGVCDGSVILCAKSGIPPYTYSWSDGYVGDARSGLCAGTYTVTVQDQKGCTTTYDFTVPAAASNTNNTNTTGSANISTNSISVAVAPNPTAGLVNVTVTAANAGKGAIVVYSSAGKAIIQKNVSLLKGYNQLQLNLSSYAEGLYYIQVITDNDTKRFKITLVK